MESLNTRLSARLRRALDGAAEDEERFLADLGQLSRSIVGTLSWEEDMREDMHRKFMLSMRVELRANPRRLGAVTQWPAWIHGNLRGLALESLLARALASDATRRDRNRFFDELARLVSLGTEAIARRCGLDDWDREELAQECLKKVHELYAYESERLLAVRQWMQWIYLVLYRLAVNAHRDRTRRDSIGELSFDPFGGPDGKGGGRPLEETADEGADPARHLETRQLILLMRRTVDDFDSERDRQVYRLYMDGHTWKKIAALTALPITTVNSIIHRRRKEVVNTVRKHLGGIL